MSSFYEGNDPDVDTEGAQDAVEQAQAWATKMDGPVIEPDQYSSQYNAGLAATSATGAAGSAAAAQTSADEAAASADALNSLVLADMVDVAETAPLDGQVLAWSEANQLWEPTDPVVVASSDPAVQAMIDQMNDVRDKLITMGVIQP